MCFWYYKPMEDRQEIVHKIRRNKIQYLPSFSVPLGNGQALEIKPTANAWWKSQIKVSRLLTSFRVGSRIPEACIEAGISRRQYKYFAHLHPEINKIRQVYKGELIKKAKATVEKNIEINPRFALRYLAKTKPEEFPQKPRGIFAMRLKQEKEKFAMELEEARIDYRNDIRQLQNIIVLYESATRFPEKGIDKAILLIIEKSVRQYNNGHRKNKIKNRNNPVQNKPREFREEDFRSNESQRPPTPFNKNTKAEILGLDDEPWSQF